MKTTFALKSDKVRPDRVTGLKLWNTKNESAGNLVPKSESEVREPAVVSKPQVNKVQVRHEKLGIPSAPSKPLSFKNLFKSLTPKRMRSWLGSPAADNKKEVVTNTSEICRVPEPNVDDWNDCASDDSDVVVFERTLSSSRTRSNASSNARSSSSSSIYSVHDFTSPEDDASGGRCADRHMPSATSCDDFQEIMSDTTTSQEPNIAVCVSEKVSTSLVPTDNCDATEVGNTNAGTSKEVRDAPLVQTVSFDDFLVDNIEKGKSHHEQQNYTTEQNEKVYLGTLQEISEEFIRFGSDEDDCDKKNTSVACNGSNSYNFV